MSQQPLRLFEKVNYIAAVAHLVQAIVTMFPENSASIPVQESYIDWVESDACTNTSTARLNEFSLTPRDHTTHELSLKWLIVCFHLLSFFFEILATDPSGGFLFPRWRERYLQAVKVGANGMRFIEYSASASVMLIAIALVSGIWDSYALIGIGFLTFITMVLGGIAEQLFSDELPQMENRVGRLLTFGDYPVTLRARYLGWICHFAGWHSMLSAYGIILRNFAFANQKSTSTAPWFVYVIVTVIFILYNIFGVIQLVQLWCKTTPAILIDPYKLEYGDRENTALNEKVEMAYVVNSLVSKSFLGWLIYANVIMGERSIC